MTRAGTDEREDGAMRDGTGALEANERPVPSALDAAEPLAVRRALEYLHAHVAHPVTLCELSRAVGLSPFHLARLFRRSVGLPPYAYLQHLRIQRAQALLRAGEPASRVAYATGFSDQSHLTRAFKRIVGMPPGRYARSQVA